VHGDYRLDNCMTDADGSVIAVLDWEICTLGDPLADVGLLMVYWSEASDANQMLMTAPTTVEGFLSRKEVLDRYAEASGRDLSHIDFYIAFGYWKLACIVEGVYARYVGGAMGSDASGFEGFALQVERCADAAADAVARLG
jgi:aminoglycoside phosphotransferase (APT) family kinase protein